VAKTVIADGNDVGGDKGGSGQRRKTILYICYGIEAAVSFEEFGFEVPVETTVVDSDDTLLPRLRSGAASRMKMKLKLLVIDCGVR
jgi:hypothetical protein